MNILSREYNKLVKASFSPEEEQEKVLLRILQKNKNSDFGKKFNFSPINSIEDYQKRVPVTDYDFLFQWIEKEMHGEARQLTESKVESFATTSGTTSDSKFIPITDDYIKAYKKGLRAWIISAFKEHPKIAGKVLTIASARIEGYTNSGIPYGAVSGLMYEHQGKMAKIHSVVKDSRIFAEKDLHMKYYTLARIALAENITHIQTANPLTILNLCRTIEDNAEKIIKDIYNGYLSADYNLKVKKNRRRAIELENLLENEEFLPMNFWKDMELIGCWTGGTQYLFLEQLEKRFGNVPIRDIGLMASEGRMTIPLRDNTSSGVLDIPHSFFEFIPENDIESKKPEILTAEQIEKGENYFILLTTGSGLYRYNILDLVKCTGFYNKTPELAFLSKGQHISNVTGEKLSEYQIVGAYKKTRIDGLPEKFILYPRVSDGKANYVFLSVQEEGNAFAERLDNALMEVNSEYRSRRDGGKLGRLEIKTVSNEEFEKISKNRLKAGNDAQYKHKYIGEINLG